MLNKLKRRLWVWYTLIKQFKLFKWFLNVSPMLLMCSILYPLQRWPNMAPILDVEKKILTPIDQTRSVNCTLFFWNKNVTCYSSFSFCNFFIKFIFYQIYFLSNLFVIYCFWNDLRDLIMGNNLQFRWCPLILIPIHLQLCSILPQLHMWHCHINLCTRQIYTLNGSRSLCR